MSKIVLASIALALAALATLATPAPTQGASACVTLYEDANLKGDYKRFCRSVADLNKVAHLQSGKCNSFTIKLDDTWDNCTSSMRFVVSRGYCISVYSASDWWPDTLMHTQRSTTGASYNLTGSYNDALTSLLVYAC